MGDNEGTPALIILLIVIFLLLDWLGAVSWMDNAATTSPAPAASAASAQAVVQPPTPTVSFADGMQAYIDSLQSPTVYVVPTPSPSAGNAQSERLAFTSGNFKYDTMTYNTVIDVNPSFVRKNE